MSDTLPFGAGSCLVVAAVADGGACEDVKRPGEIESAIGCDDDATGSRRSTRRRQVSLVADRYGLRAGCSPDFQAPGTRGCLLAASRRLLRLRFRRALE